MRQCEIWIKPLADKSVAVSVINRGSRPDDVTVRARDIGMLDTPKLGRNLWTQEDIADFKTDFIQRVQPHETVVMKITSA
jgi:alpha-galactosidase